MKLPSQPPAYNASFEQQRSGIIEREFGVRLTDAPTDGTSYVRKAGEWVKAPSGAPGSWPQTAAEAAAGIQPVSVYFEPGDVRRYGATGDGSTDDAAAFTAAISANDNIFVPDAPTAWKLGSTVTISAGKTVYGSGLGSYITKGANGAMFSLGKNTVLRDVYLDGKGATYTGVGITIPYSNEFEGYQLISNCRIYYTASYCVEYAAAKAGFASKIESCDMSVVSNTVPCVKYPVDGLNLHGNRAIINCAAGSGPLVDINGCENCFIIGNTCGDSGSSASILFDTGSRKAIVVGNRISAATTMTVKGQSHTIIGNTCGAAITLASDASDCYVASNVCAGTNVDNSTNNNQLDTRLASYTGAWTGASSNPAVGNGEAYYFYVREGQVITVYIGVSMGSTTTYGSGAWRFSLPRACSGSVNAFGKAIMYDSSATKYYTGIAKVDGAGTYLTIIPEGSTSGETASTVPFTWASGDFMRLQLSYPA